jgi:hypothetical protein
MNLFFLRRKGSFFSGNPLAAGVMPPAARRTDTASCPEQFVDTDVKIAAPLSNAMVSLLHFIPVFLSVSREKLGLMRDTLGSSFQSNIKVFRLIYIGSAAAPGSCGSMTSERRAINKQALREALPRAASLFFLAET